MKHRHVNPIFLHCLLNLSDTHSLLTYFNTHIFWHTGILTHTLIQLKLLFTMLPLFTLAWSFHTDNGVPFPSTLHPQYQMSVVLHNESAPAQTHRIHSPFSKCETGAACLWFSALGGTSSASSLSGTSALKTKWHTITWNPNMRQGFLKCRELNLEGS